MKSILQIAFDSELVTARRLVDCADFDGAFVHLERAHVIGQYHLIPHVRSHWAMLRIGIKRRSTTQVWGQTIRLVLGAIGSVVNVVPSGNTGGTNISMFQRLPIPPEIEDLFRE